MKPSLTFLFSLISFLILTACGTESSDPSTPYQLRLQKTEKADGTSSTLTLAYDEKGNIAQYQLIDFDSDLGYQTRYTAQYTYDELSWLTQVRSLTENISSNTIIEHATATYEYDFTSLQVIKKSTKALS